jgi:L-aspartate oxidase
MSEVSMRQSKHGASSDAREYDVLVIGSGIAGLTAAIAAAERGARVAVLSKASSPEECNTRYAQGGIVGKGAGDTPELLAEDIMAAGDRINSHEAVAAVAREGPRLLEELLIRRVGVRFDTAADGGWDLTQEAAHSVRRIYHAKDLTGAAIEEALLRHARGLPGITFHASHVAIDLITNTHNSRDDQERYRGTRVIGAYVLDALADEIRRFFAPSVLLATGGVGDLFLHTSNPPGATGDGVAMAYRIGAEVLNAEYVQFHPTILYHRDVQRFLISESLRGEGARLVNRAGERFMERYDPERKDLAPRDEVTRAIYREMEQEDSGYVRLDTSDMHDVDLASRFPGIFAQCQAVGIDIRREPIPVVPAAHYFCGGIKVDLEGRTSIPGLYAVGECSCTGVHGANRLASVSLLEGLVWGNRAGIEVAGRREAPPARLLASIPEWVRPEPEEAFDPVLVNQDMHTLRSTMWNYAGIMRSRKRLLRALADFDYLSHRVDQFYRGAGITRRILELRNGILAGTLIVQAALANRVSIGCHYVEPS